MVTSNQQICIDKFTGADTEETSSLPSVMPLGVFLPALLQALEREGVHLCVLRNYDGLPACNSGRDVDCLIRASDLPLTIRALKSIQGIRIVGYSERSFVASVFLEGISSIAQSHALQVDFYLSLTWKGLVYLPADAVLQAAIARPAGNSTFLVPMPVHEAITSLLSSLIIGGSVKEKYFPQVQRTFASNRGEVIAALSPQFGAKSAVRLADSVIGGDRERVRGCVRALRASLVLRNLLRRPLRSTLAVVRHYAYEVAIRYSPRTLATVCILRPGSSERTAIIETLMPILQSTAVIVEERCSQPQLSRLHDSPGNSPAEGNSRARDSRLVSMARIVSWMVTDWLRQLNRMPTLRVTESRSYDLISDTEWHRYGIPKWFAWLVTKLLPAPDLWILLDPGTGEMQAANHECLPAQALRQLDACRSLVKTKKQFVILEAGVPGFRVTEEVYSAIIAMLAQRADKRLKSRF